MSQIPKGQGRADYDQTSSAIARDAGMTVPTVNLYADLGLLDCIRASNGARLYRRGQAERARAIYNERMAGRGNRRKG